MYKSETQDSAAESADSEQARNSDRTQYADRGPATAKRHENGPARQCEQRGRNEHLKLNFLAATL